MKAYNVCFPAISIINALSHLMNIRSRIATPTLIPEKGLCQQPHVHHAY